MTLFTGAPGKALPYRAFGSLGYVRLEHELNDSTTTLNKAAGSGNELDLSPAHSTALSLATHVILSNYRNNDDNCQQIRTTDNSAT